MEFVLCIRFAFTKIETAQFICVAQFVTIRNPSSKTLSGKEENDRVAENNPFRTLSPGPVVRRPRYFNPRTVARLIQPFGDFTG